MVKSTPLLKKRIVKKRTLKFTRFQSDLYGGRLAESWRRPRGSSKLIQALITASDFISFLKTLACFNTSLDARIREHGL